MIEDGQCSVINQRGRFYVRSFEKGNVERFGHAGSPWAMKNKEVDGVIPNLLPSSRVSTPSRPASAACSVTHSVYRSSVYTPKSDTGPQSQPLHYRTATIPIGWVDQSDFSHVLQTDAMVGGGSTRHKVVYILHLLGFLLLLLFRIMLRNTSNARLVSKGRLSCEVSKTTLFEIVPACSLR